MYKSRQQSVIFHLGAHKTGTSLVQKFMRDNSDKLKKLNIHYISRTETNTLVGWGQQLINNPNMLRERILEEFSEGARNVIVSHENILGRPFVKNASSLYPKCDASLTALGKVCHDIDYKVLWYIRSQESFLESYYLQLIHQAKHCLFDDWLDTINLENISWKPACDSIRKRFGKENVNIAPFEEIHSGQAAFLRNFFLRAQLDVKIDTNYKPMRNLSIGDKGLKIALAVNKFMITGKEKKLMRIFLQKHFSNRDYPRPLLLDDAYKLAIRHKWADEYESLIDRL